MKKAAICLLTAAVLCVGQAPGVWALTDQPTIKPILITELQTGGATNATEEFVELYNPNDIAVDVTGWQLQYRAASGTAAQTWPVSSLKATLACPTGSAASCTVQIAPQDRLLLVHTIANIAGALPMTGGFSATGGEIRLIEPGTTPTVQDFIGYGTAADSEGTPADAPAPGKTLKRVLDTDGNPIDTDHNATDFIAGCGEPSPGAPDTSPLPYATGCKTLQTDDTSAQSGQTTDSSDTSGTDQLQDPSTTSDPTATYLPILITEVFPDPATPAQDSADEFIELFNPNDTTVTLSGYTLQTGTDWRYHFTLGDTPLGPHDYYAVSSAVTKLSLSNSGSGVRLIDPDGQIVFEVPTYGDAKEGQAWMPNDGAWQWTLTPTPNAPNILTVPAPKAALTAGTVPKKTTKSTAAAAKKSTKTAVPKLPKAAKKTAAPKTATATGQVPTTNSTPQYWLLAPIGAIAGGYALYEYRSEINRGTKKLLGRLSGKKRQQLLGDDAQDLV